MSRFELLFAMLTLCLMYTSVLSAAENETTAFFKNHPNDIDFKEAGDRLLFANRHVGIEFQNTDQGFQLNRIYGIAEEQDLLVPGAAALRDLFEVRMVLDPKFAGRDDRGKQQRSLMGAIDEMAKGSFGIGSTIAKPASWRCEGNQAESTLHLEWKDLDAQEEKGVVDLHVTIRLRAGDPLSYWRINVRNRGARYGIERVRFPILNLAPLGKAEENALILPQSRGRMIAAPFKDQTFQGYYTCEYEMQFQALYNQQTAAGTYMATQQSVPNLSHVQTICSPTEIKWITSHFPANITFAQDAPGDDAEDYNMSYDVVVGPFSGDWYDACQIYRQWAIQQSWCSKGPLSTRQDIPQWYKEAPLYFYTMLNDSGEGTHSMEENLKIAANDFREWLAWAGMKLPMNLYAWEEPTQGMSVRDMPFHPARSTQMSKSGRWSGMTGHNFYDGNYPGIPSMKIVSSELASLRKEGGMVSPYVALELFNPGPSENAPYAAEAKPHAIRDLFGAIQTWGGEEAWQMCSASSWWNNRLVETCTLLMKNENAGGIYLDVMRGSCLPCYWTPHGHTAAGGSSMTTTRHDQIRAIRDAVKAIDPEAIITGENPSENVIDVIDGMLIYHLWPDNLPVMATVYQDYIKRYGLEVSSGLGYRNRFAPNWDENAFFIECASMFTEGAQIGRLRLKPRDANLSVSNPAHKEMVDFLGKVVAYYKLDASKPYLSVGQLMRPLAFKTPSPMPMIPYKPGGQFPAIMAGVFRIDDGSLGVFIVNASNQETAFEAELDPVRYSMAAGTVVSVQNISFDGTTKDVSTKAEGRVAMKATLPAHGITMFKIVPAAE